MCGASWGRQLCLYMESEVTGCLSLSLQGDVGERGLAGRPGEKVCLSIPSLPHSCPPSPSHSLVHVHKACRLSPGLNDSFHARIR